MAVGILPAVSHRGVPRAWYLIAGRAQTGRVNACGYSTLRERFGRRGKEPDKNRQTTPENPDAFRNSHKP
jgi:hypothetical protein